MLNPLGPRVLVEVLPMPEVSEGGLLLPGAADQRPRRGRVLALGDVDRVEERAGRTISEGDVVVFGRYAGVEAGAFDGVEQLLLSAEELLAIEVSSETLVMEFADLDGSDWLHACQVTDLDVSDGVVRGHVASEVHVASEIAEAGYVQLRWLDGQGAVVAFRGKVDAVRLFSGPGDRFAAFSVD